MELRALALLLSALQGSLVTAEKGINSFAGPYIAYGEKFYTCEEPEERMFWTWHVRVTHFNPVMPEKPQQITGNVTGTEYSLDDSLWIHAYVDKRSNNQWKENAFIAKFPNKACSMFRTHMPDVFRVIFNGAKMDGPCTAPPGVYTLKNAPIRWLFPSFPVMPYGFYRFRLQFGKGKLVGACFVADCHIIPKLT